MLGGHCPESDQMLNDINHDCHLHFNNLWLLDHNTYIALEPQNCIFHLQDHGVQCSIHKERASSRRLSRALKYCSTEEISSHSQWKCGDFCYQNCLLFQQYLLNYLEVDSGWWSLSFPLPAWSKKNGRLGPCPELFEMEKENPWGESKHENLLWQKQSMTCLLEQLNQEMRQRCRKKLMPWGWLNLKHT